MTVNQRNSSQKKPRGKGKPFKRNDPLTGEKDERINRDGALKPRSVRDLEKLLDEIFDEELTVTSNDGKPEKMTELKALLKRMLRSKNIGGGIHVLDRRFGKVAEKLDLSNSDGSLKPETMKPSEIAERVAAMLEQKKKNA
jgi:hypothetical protein